MPYRIVDKLKTEGKSDDEVKSFKTGATTFVKKVLDDFKEFQFYTGKRLVLVLTSRRHGGGGVVWVAHYVVLYVTRRWRGFGHLISLCALIFCVPGPGRRLALT